MSNGEKLFSLIDQSRRILVIAHRRPDGDTTGSACAFLDYLLLKGKIARGFCIDIIPENLGFLLPETDIFFHDVYQLDLNSYDLIIAVDCGELKQTGISEILQNRPVKTLLINIDHHHTNDYFGDMNIVESQASSTAEIVHNLFLQTGKILSKRAINCLLTGILTDTTYFSNAATTSSAIKSASTLLEQGAKINQITQKIWQNKNLASLQLWGKIFERIIFNQETKTATAIITKDDLDTPGLPDDSLEGISNYLTSLADTKIVLVLMQIDDNTIKGSLRTTYDDVDVSEIAQRYGGGGHKKAAGFTTHGKIVFDDISWKIKTT
ncbi:hypothetical protein A2533_04235 [Candidatus Falkowbacteria bacterium RIFOXYD2_FULL_35_9]|uniref:DDH domain-containing protein n=1 Tax=Candidatus Falkowbacteria bacterium RIFOXYC2_FULL_36_12 TaxID=1798002 RepID=A0A1F5T362_9BACT|nr:MAG: hypothetical protein A2478_01450 [Candidatus Falkowbacteria bacterium RIFOXYC2_FULL_36_12]OGF33976.1 MAG: hypothetical protein A2223_01910 [Candidatus Falkowbacteria bacterium RIFOXYA2_FULL_35_8]OGF48524.1 MAG: hypothetical protein A2533_04235 [Candidatus Falkowbacteria bacterium RIFOXYD2_FULL_35_9]